MRRLLLLVMLVLLGAILRSIRELFTDLVRMILNSHRIHAEVKSMPPSVHSTRNQQETAA
jgi:hypothetical protein